MPAKKAKGKKSPRSERAAKVEKRNYQLISGEELQAMSEKHMAQRDELLHVLHHIYDAETQWEEYMDEQRDLNEWEFFIRCEGLPKPYLIPDIHLFIEKLRHFEADCIQSNMNWLLAVNELSVLTQDIFQKNTTKDILKQEISPKFGQEYSTYVTNILKLIDNIDEFLNDNVVVDSFPFQTINEIIKEKRQLYVIIREFFDRYSYRVICSENANCNTINARTTEYSYENTNFQIHIWMLKNVPISFSELDALDMLAELSALKLTVLMPYVVLSDNLILRGIHYEFDHFSEAARSFKPKLKPPAENISALLTDLFECLMSEWDLYLTIQDEVRNNMIRKRAEFEEKLLAFEEAEAAAAKAAKNQDAKTKPKKKLHVNKPIEQPLMPENMFPEVSEDFYEKEFSLLREFKEANFNPINLRLHEDEVNLRKYYILGGVYELYFLHKPNHIDNNFSHYNMTWHENNEHAKVFKDYYIHATSLKSALIDIEEIRKHRSRVSYISRSSNLSTKLEEREERNEVDSYFELKFELPAMLCDFDVPIVCQYEDNIDDWVDAELVEWAGSGRETQQFKLTGTPRATIDSGNTDVVSIRSMASAYFRPTTNAGFISDSMVLTANAFDNFLLDLEIAKPELRALQRHVLPRILSSYKFPDEVARELKQGDNASTSTKAGGQRKMRKKATSDEDLTLASHIFTHRNQNNPERIFPVFPNIEQLNVTVPKNMTAWTEEPETFFDLLQMFEVLNKYMSFNYRKILRVPGLKLKRTKLGRQILAAMAKSAKRRSKDSHLAEKTSLRKSKPLSRANSRITRSIREINLPEPQQTTYKKIQYSHWTTKHIIYSSYDKTLNLMTVHTSRLGVFGFAFDRYAHFPFKYWSLAANEENPEHEILLIIETQHVKCVITISADGYKAYVTEPTKGFVRFPKKYLVSEEPMTDLRLFKKLFRDRHLNIFPEADASYYLKDDYFCEKHLATELHTYICMALHCGRIRFEYCIWNRLAQRRDLVLNFVHAKEISDGFLTVRISPEKTTFVEIKELCSDNLEHIKLEYTPTWRNLDHCSDLNQALISAYSSANDDRIRDFMLICNVRNLLSEIRLLSFS